MFYIFGEIKQMEKTALIRGPKNMNKLIQANISSTNN